MSRSYGYHLHEVVADVHRSVTNLTEQEKENRHHQLTQWHTTDRTTLHISELADEERRKQIKYRKGVSSMANEEWVTQAQARQLPRDYGASPDEIEREIARDYRSATDQSAGHELGKAITDASASEVDEAAVAAYGAANPPPESPAVEELTGALHDELADALDQARARLVAGDVPEVDRPAHQAQIELFEAELAGDEAIPKQLARGGGDPMLAGKTAAWLAAEAATTQRWIAVDAVAGAQEAVADTQRLHSQRAERWPAAHWPAADDHAGTVGDEVELGSHDEALPPA
jgi:hypothetical protein